MGIFTSKSVGKKELALADEQVKEGNLDRALSLAKEGLKLLRQKGSNLEITRANAKILHIQGLINQKEGNLRNAAAAFGQSARYFSQVGLTNDFERLTKKQAKMLIELGRKLSDEKDFDDAARNFEEAAAAYKNINKTILSLEIRAKAFILRAASVKNPPDRKRFLLEAVQMFKDSGIQNPTVSGHFHYYTALVDKLTNLNKAVESLDSAIDYYKEANNANMIRRAEKLQEDIKAQLSS